MKEILVDIETYSEVDIGKCGLYRYATDPSFEILLIAWATDEGDGFGETRCADLASGEVIPDELLEAFQSGSVRLIAHNAAFERVCFSVHLNRHYPGQYLKPGDFLSPDSWICTMVMAASLTLPLALKDVGTVLKTSQQKDKEGERLIKLFSVPCKPTKSNGMRTRNLPEHYPADWAKFKYYCIQDVNTEVDIYKRLKKFPMTELEWQHYRTNERINDRGVRIDTELVQEAITCDLMLSDAMSKKAYELTGLENPNSVSQLKTWLEERGIPMDTLGRYPESAVRSAVSDIPFRAPCADMKYSNTSRPSRKLDLIGSSIVLPVVSAIKPRIPASCLICLSEPRAPESAIMKMLLYLSSPVRSAVVSSSSVSFQVSTTSL